MDNLSIRLKLAITFMVVVIASFFIFSIVAYNSSISRIYEEAETSANSLIQRSAQMFMVSTKKFHNQYINAKDEQEKKRVHLDWIRTIEAVDDAVINDFGDGVPRVRLIGDLDITGSAPMGGDKTKIEIGFERDALKAFMNKESVLKVKEDEYLRVAVPLKSSFHAGCAECHSLDVNRDFLLGSVNSYIPTKSLIEKAKIEFIKNIATLIIILIVIFIIIYLLIGKIVLTPISKLNLMAKNLASGDGDLTKTLEVNGNDEIAKASKSINEFIEKVRNTISNIKNSSNETASIANELSVTAENIGKRVEKEAKIVENTVEDGLKDKDLLNISLQTSQNTKEDIEKSNKNLESAKNEILKMVSQIQKSSHIEEELSQKLNQLSSEADAVKGVLTVIADIADQTNLLALNAAIEAARAGEHGRGFAVVADEVRQLAERTQKSLTEINSTINVIVQSIVDVSEQMNKNAKDIQNLSKVSEKVEYKINETANLMIQSAYTANKSLDNTTEIVNNYQNRIKKIESINELSNSNARSLEETISATDHLHKMTEGLSIKLNEFKT